MLLAANLYLYRLSQARRLCRGEFDALFFLFLQFFLDICLGYCFKPDTALSEVWPLKICSLAFTGSWRSRTNKVALTQHANTHSCNFSCWETLKSCCTNQVIYLETVKITTQHCAREGPRKETKIKDEQAVTGNNQAKALLCLWPVLLSLLTYINNCYQSYNIYTHNADILHCAVWILLKDASHHGKVAVQDLRMIT